MTQPPGGMHKFRAALSSLKGQHIFMITVLLVFAIGATWYYGAYSSRKLEIDAARQQVQTLDGQVQAARQAKAQVPGLQIEVARLEVERDELFRALPPTANIAGVLGEIRSNVQASGADWNAVTQGNGATTGLPAGVRPITFALTLNGTFEQLFTILQSLEDMNRFSTINTLQLSTGAADSLDPKLSSNLGVTVYTFDPAAVAPAAATGTTTPLAPAAPAPSGSAP